MRLGIVLAYAVLTYVYISKEGCFYCLSNNVFFVHSVMPASFFDRDWYVRGNSTLVNTHAAKGSLESPSLSQTPTLIGRNYVVALRRRPKPEVKI